MQKKYEALIFDFDGTLADTRASILNAWTLALEHCDFEPVVPLGDWIYTLPLMGSAEKLAPTGETKQKLAQLYTHFYDTVCWNAATEYEGMSTLLSTLKRNQTKLVLISNKRVAPLLRLMDYLGWSHIFDRVDGANEAGYVDSKDVRIRKSLEWMKLTNQQGIYIGDVREDECSAHRAQIDFLYARWNPYCESDTDPEPSDICLPSDLLNLVSLRQPMNILRTHS